MERDTNRSNEDEGRKGRSTASNVALFGFLALAAFYLIAEHRAHLLGWLPWLLILACPLLHVFMHGRHGGHDEHSDRSFPHSRQPPHRH